MNKGSINIIKFKTIDGRTVVECKPCTLDDKIKQVCTLPTLSLNLCDSEFKNPPHRFINFIVSYVQDFIGKSVYLVTYLPLRTGMEDVDVYQGVVKNSYSINMTDNSIGVSVNVYVKAWKIDVCASPVAIFETKEEAEKFADYLRDLKGSTLEVVASEVTTVIEGGCETKRYLMVSPEHDNNFVLD